MMVSKIVTTIELPYMVDSQKIGLLGAPSFFPSFMTSKSYKNFSE